MGRKDVMMMDDLAEKRQANIEMANVARVGRFLIYRQAVCRPQRTSEGKYYSKLHGHTFWLMELRAEFDVKCALLGVPAHVRHVRDRNVVWRQQIGSSSHFFKPLKSRDFDKYYALMAKKDKDLLLRATLLAKHLSKYKRNPLAVAYERETRKEAKANVRHVRARRERQAGS